MLLGSRWLYLAGLNCPQMRRDVLPCAVRASVPSGQRSSPPSVATRRNDGMAWHPSAHSRCGSPRQEASIDRAAACVLRHACCTQNSPQCRRAGAITRGLYSQIARSPHTALPRRSRQTSLGEYRPMPIARAARTHMHVGVAFNRQGTAAVLYPSMADQVLHTGTC